MTYYENLISSNPEYEYVGVFADRGITGTKDNRPEFQRMLGLCREGHIDFIITKSISRFARNTVVMEAIRLTSVSFLSLANVVYIEDNHSPIVAKEVWEQVQQEMKKRAEVKGDFKNSGKYRNRYPLSGMLFCSKCGASLKRRTWNSKHACRKIVWQCSNYIENGKDACAGTTIEDSVISSVNIQGPTVVKEVMKNGKKHYSYSSQGQPNQPSGKYQAQEKENGSILPSLISGWLSVY